MCQVVVDLATDAGTLPALHDTPYAGVRWDSELYELTVDGADQRESTGELLYWRDGAVGACADVYPGVRFERHVVAADTALVDVVWARASATRKFTLHSPTDADVTLIALPGGYRTCWVGDGGLTGRHVAIPEAVLSTAPGLGPADDPQRARQHLSWQVAADEVVFASVYTAADAEFNVAVEPGPAVRIGEQTYRVPFARAKRRAGR